MPVLADKVAVKAIVTEKLGRNWVIPMLWSGQEFPTAKRFAAPIVLKSRHGCNQTLILNDDNADWLRAQRTARNWMRQPYGRWLDEWLYQEIPLGCLIEPFVSMGDDLPIDYKIFVFHGRAAYVQVHLDRATRHRWVVHDLDWRRLSGTDPIIPRPTALKAMIEAAELLADDFSFARVDFYQPGKSPFFGEITFYPGSGLDPFNPSWLDEEMGKLWLDGARRGSAGNGTLSDTFVA